MSAFLPEMKNALYTKDSKSRLNGYSPYRTFGYYFRKTDAQDSLSKLQYVDMKTYLSNDILVKVDRMSMANSLEVRSPLLDHKFIEFAAAIPSSLKLKGRIAKYIFKKSLEEKLPPDILNRRKKGFCAPVASWLRNDMKGLAEGLLFSKEAKARGYFNYTFIQRMWRRHQRGLRDYSAQLWALLMLEMWHKRFIDQEVL